MSAPTNPLRVAKEAVQATALVSRIICFLAFTADLFHGPRETYQIGGLIDRKTVGDTIGELSNAHNNLKGCKPSNTDNKDLRRLVRDLTELSSRLSNIITEFEEAEAKGREVTWLGLMVAGKSLCRDKEVLQLQHDIQGYQDRIFEMLTSFVRYLAIRSGPV